MLSNYYLSASNARWTAASELERRQICDEEDRSDCRQAARTANERSRRHNDNGSNSSEADFADEY